MRRQLWVWFRFLCCVVLLSGCSKTTHQPNAYPYRVGLLRTFNPTVTEVLHHKNSRGRHNLVIANLKAPPNLAYEGEYHIDQTDFQRTTVFTRINLSEAPLPGVHFNRIRLHETKRQDSPDVLLTAQSDSLKLLIRVSPAHESVDTLHRIIRPKTVDPATAWDCRPALYAFQEGNRPGGLAGV
ncbi:hypothetical protein GF324_00685, partial [bacterium]|nr:hypothetical protein [bacterium]